MNRVKTLSKFNPTDIVEAYNGIYAKFKGFNLIWKDDDDFILLNFKKGRGWEKFTYLRTLQIILEENDVITR